MPALHLATELRLALVRLGRRMRREEPVAELGQHHLSALGAMQQLEEPTLARIAAIEGVKPPSMVKTLQHLESLDIIERHDHPTDGRMVVLRISAHGEEVLADLRERRNRQLATWIEALDDDERAVLERAVPILARLAEA